MDEGGLTPWLISALLILFADYIAVCETALASASKVKMKTLAEHGNKKAVKVLDALDHFDRTISAILILTNIAHLATASLVTVAVTRRWGLSAVTVSTILTSLVVFFFGEMLPKSIAKKYSNKLALWLGKNPNRANYEMSDEQRAAASERMKKMNSSKSAPMP